MITSEFYDVYGVDSLWLDDYLNPVTSTNTKHHYVAAEGGHSLFLGGKGMLTEFPGCCGIAVWYALPHNVPSHTEFITKFAKRLGYTKLLITDTKEHGGFDILGSFINTRTDNDVFIMGVDL